ncbi:MAG: hypothetical protein AAF961_15650 [Planctomycetota bacterium]
MAVPRPHADYTNAHADYPSVPGEAVRAAVHVDAWRNPETESIEQEISRLTWTVLDGGASPEDRRRLALLVNEQHVRRRGLVG